MMEVDYAEASEQVTVVKFRKHALNEKHLLASAESDGTVNVYDATSDLTKNSLYESKDHFFPVNDV